MSGPRALQPCAPWVFSLHRAALSPPFSPPPCPPLGVWGQACMGQVPPAGCPSVVPLLPAVPSGPAPAGVHLFSTCQRPYLPDFFPDFPPLPGRPLELCRPRPGLQGPIQICQVSLETSLETSGLRKEEQQSTSHWARAAASALSCTCHPTSSSQQNPDSCLWLLLLCQPIRSCFSGRREQAPQEELEGEAMLCAPCKPPSYRAVVTEI